MKKILFFSPTGTLDNGAEISIFYLMKYLVGNGYEVINVAPTYVPIHENEYSKKMQEEDIHCYLLFTQRWWWEDAPGDSLGNEIQRAESYRQVIFKLNELIERENVDIVITNTVNMFQGAIAAAIKEIPHIWLLHEFPEDEFKYYKEKIDFIDHYSSEIFTVVGNLNLTLKEYFPKHTLKEFIPYTDISVVGLKKGKKHRIVSVGRLTERKNQKELIQAFGLLDVPDLELVFIGGWDDSYKKKCDQYIKENNIKNILFLGNQKNPWSLLTNKDICVFSSAKETFGLVYVETVLNGIPVILSDNPGHLSAYELFSAGSLYKLGNVEELKNTISTTLNNFDERKKEAFRYKEMAQQKYQASTAYCDIIDSIETLSSNPAKEVRHIKNLLMLNENKSKLANLEYKVRLLLSKAKRRIFK